MQRRLGWGPGFAIALIVLWIAACEDTVETNGPATSTTTTGGGDGGNGATGADGGGGVGGIGGEGGVEGPTTSDKVDILMVVDNSRGMAHMQDVLSQSVSRLVSEITALGVTDMHIGVVSSSLGGLGADACSSGLVGEDDSAGLIDRAPVGTVATYEGKGFLAWDPNQVEVPPGEASEAALTASLGDLVLGAGDAGCGYESPLEAFYRFLIDPDPYASIALQAETAVMMGTDNALLQQRAAFLRPDSLVMVVIASDENDCSTRAGGQFYFARQIYQPGSNSPYHLPGPRAACATNPADPCCRSCGQQPGEGCDDSQDQCGTLTSLEDNINLRCFEQKRRFGIDFLWPVDRYRAGLSHAQVEDRFGNIVANPLYSGQRGSELVVVAGIVGIPWQLSSRGGDAASGAQRADEMASQWSAVLGDPASYTPPSSPYMVESIGPRGGIAGPSSDHDADAIVGHDHTNPQNDGLQYACVWDLPAPVDCTTAQTCLCSDPGNDDALCQNPTTEAFTTNQYRAAALPGLRHLALLRGLGHRAVVGSACPAQMTDASQVSFGHHPTFATLAELAAARID